MLIRGPAVGLQILLVDDHALLREGLALLLKQLDPDVRVLEAGTLAAAYEQVAANADLGLVLLDLDMPDGSGLDAIAGLGAARPGLAIVVLSATQERAAVLRCIDAGAIGFIPKSSSSQDMLAGLRTVLAGGIHLPSNVFSDRAPGSGATRGRSPAEVLGLTPRQSDVLRCILKGLPIKSIARELDVSVSTAKAHTAVILRALDVTTRTQVVVEFSRLGLRLEPDRPDA